MNTSPAQAASVRKIANYSQSISSSVTNLLTEIGRASASAAAAAPSSTNDGAVLRMLQTISTQITAVHTRLDKMQGVVEDLDKRLDRVEKRLEGVQCQPEVTGGEMGTAVHLPEPVDLLGVEEYTKRARLLNKEAKRGDSVLIPLPDSTGKPVPDFPPTLGHLAHLENDKLEKLSRAFGLEKVNIEILTQFVGVNWDFVRSAMEYYVVPEMQAKYRNARKERREQECARIGPPTPATRAAAENHNRRARAHNKKAKSFNDTLIPLHDSRNRPVDGFPTTLYGQANFQHRWDVLYLLEEYGLSTEAEHCEARWNEFIGIDTETLFDFVEDGPLAPRYYYT